MYIQVLYVYGYMSNVDNVGIESMAALKELK